MENYNVLVVSKLAPLRRILKQGLRKRYPGLTIEEAMDGREAQGKLFSCKGCHLLISDWELPVLEGSTLLHWIKSQPEFSTIPVIMLFTKANSIEVISAIKLGVTSIIIKPFKIEELIKRITATIDYFNMRDHKRFEADGVVSLRSSSRRVCGKLLNISQGGLCGIFEAENVIPQMLENIVVDINPDNRPSILGVDGLVVRVQASETGIESKFIKLAVKFLNMAPEKNDEIMSFIIDTIDTIE